IRPQLGIWATVKTGDCLFNPKCRPTVSIQTHTLPLNPRRGYMCTCICICICICICMWTFGDLSRNVSDMSLTCLGHVLIINGLLLSLLPFPFPPICFLVLSIKESVFLEIYYPVVHRGSNAYKPATIFL